MSSPKFTVSTVARAVPYDNDNIGLESDNVQEFIDDGLLVKNESLVQFTVNSGFTKIYYNLSIQDGFVISIEDGGTLIV